MLPSRLKRRLLLRLLARQSADSLLASARKQLPAVLASAVRRSPAYRQLLAEAGLDAAALRRDVTLEKLPVLDKGATFERFGLPELLASDVQPGALGSVLTSSGYGGRSFGFGVSDRRAHAETPDAIDLGLQNAFGVDDRRTLLINTLPMGVVFESRAACVSNVSVREDMALAILRQAGPSFEQLILVIDPLFGKRLLDAAEQSETDLGAQRIHMVIGEETFQESFRDYLYLRLGLDADGRPRDGSAAPFLGSSMGVGELGLNLFFETPETVALRRALRDANPWQRQPMLFCYNPLRSWVEIHEPDADGVGTLLITMMDRRATVPLPRYATGDRVSTLDQLPLHAVPDPVRAAVEALPFPVLALHGRARDELAPGLHVDDLKSLQYRDAGIAAQLSGAFRVAVDNGALHWHLQANPAATDTTANIAARLSVLLGEWRAATGAADVPHADVRVFTCDAFPYGMTLDYERKFRYAGPVS